MSGAKFKKGLRDADQALDLFYLRTKFCDCRFSRSVGGDMTAGVKIEKQVT